MTRVKAGEARKGEEMRYVYMDTKAIRFQSGGHGINVFWYDFISGRGKGFFFARLKEGIKLLLTGK